MGINVRHKISCFSSDTAFFLCLVGSCLFMLSGCQPQTQHLPLTASYQQQPISCDTISSAQTSDWQINTLRFFISDVAFKSSGRWQTVDLQTNAWQTGNVSLLSLVTPDCELTELNRQLTFKAEHKWQDAEAVRFTLGVPFEQNHLNPLQQPSPLNLSAMFWSWQLGHKFLRLDMRGPQAAWSFHLGSIGCQSASRVRSPNQPCAKPNRIEVELGAPTSGSLQVDLDRLLDNVSMQQMQSCMFQLPDLPSCEQLLINLNTQKVFRWQ